MYAVILSTANDRGQADRIAQRLVEDELVACVNIVEGVQSVYKWKGKVQTDAEVLMVMKTRVELYKDVEEAVLALHPYEVPEIIMLPIQDGSAAYLNWLNDSTRG